VTDLAIAGFSPRQAYAFALSGDTNLVFHWPGSYMPVRVYAEPTGQLPGNVAAAMSLWVGAFRCGELSLTATADSTHADIIVRNPGALPLIRAATRAIRADSVGACQGLTTFTTIDTTLAGPIRSFVAPISGDSTALRQIFRQPFDPNQFTDEYSKVDAVGFGFRANDYKDCSVENVVGTNYLFSRDILREYSKPTIWLYAGASEGNNFDGSCSWDAGMVHRFYENIYAANLLPSERKCKHTKR